MIRIWSCQVSKAFQSSLSRSCKYMIYRQRDNFFVISSEIIWYLPTCRWSLPAWWNLHSVWCFVIPLTTGGKKQHSLFRRETKRNEENVAREVQKPKKDKQICLYSNISKTKILLKHITTHWAEQFSSGLLWKTLPVLCWTSTCRLENEILSKFWVQIAKKQGLKSLKKTITVSFNVKSLSRTRKVSCWFSLHFHCRPEKYFCRIWIFIKIKISCMIPIIQTIS